MQPHQPQVIRILGAGGGRRLDGRGVLLGCDVGADHVRRQRGVLRRGAARLVERRDRLVVLSELLVREAQMRQQDRDVESRLARRLAAVARHDRRQFVDDRLKLMTLAERLGQRVIAARRFRVQRDHAARRRFGRLSVAGAALRLRQQIQREFVGPAARDDLGEHVARLDDVVAAAGVQAASARSAF